ncbi:hypothetical protein KIN_24390 [Litoreibacter roseus]|uniref:Uncharacterized protein n=1 Tax=Litoreibacter roseus TaxID=2601869 RepID=A0A6N6JGX5_9RHOB|nr:hypothetical protein KIN_24390 [Litoreibacter roseus]
METSRLSGGSDLTVPNDKLLAIVTALVLIGSPGAAQQDVSIQELRNIEALINQKDWTALYSYVVSNPKLTTGRDPLSSELRSFVNDVQRGRVDQFNAARNASGARAAVDPDIY